MVYDYQFNAMISSVGDTEATADTTSTNPVAQTLLARIKAVSADYPLYGEVEIASGNPLWQQLKPNTVVVETQVLTGLNLQVGDQVQIGEATFTIADELITEPDRPLTAFGFGARVLMSDSDVEATDLMGQRSRVDYRIELAGPAEAISNQQTQLETLLEDPSEVEITDAEEANTSVTEVSDNVLMF